MTFSALISGVLPHHNKHRGKGPVKRIVVHHWAGTKGGDSRLTNPKARASASYILYADGKLKGQVPEEYRPWTTGPTGDTGSVTVETQNSTGAPRWGISAASAETLALLMADLSTRYGWGELKLGTNVRVHRDFAATACPGPSMLALLPSIVERANEIRAGKPKPKPKVKPKTPPKPPLRAVLHRGGTGDRVRMLQRGLNKVFPAYSKLATDSSFGPATERAVREFQRRSGLVVDGIVGPLTQAALAKHGIRL